MQVFKKKLKNRLASFITHDSRICKCVLFYKCIIFSFPSFFDDIYKYVNEFEILNIGFENHI